MLYNIHVHIWFIYRQYMILFYSILLALKTNVKFVFDINIIETTI